MSETKTGYVQGRERAKSGKSWKLKLEGKWIAVSNRANLDGIDQGAFVEYELGGFAGDNGSWIPSVERIRPAQAPQGGYPPNPRQGGQNAANSPSNAPSRLTSAHWDDSALRFISNVVGCAVEAGHAKDPTDVLAWASAAEQALKNLGQAQASAGGPGSASREPGSDDEPPPFDDSDVPW